MELNYAKVKSCQLTTNRAWEITSKLLDSNAREGKQRDFGANG